jgi:hypothetical protein
MARIFHDRFASRQVEFEHHPAISGRHVRTGARQSMPSSEGVQEYPPW